MCIRDRLYVVEERAQGAPALVTGVNVRLPMHLTASGRAILAALPRAQVRALYPDRDAFVHRHDNSDAINAARPIDGDHEIDIDRYSRLRAVLDATTTRGFALERGSVTPGFSSVAMPVNDHRGWPVAAVAVTFRDDEATADRLAELASHVRVAAETLSTRIYGRAAH